MEKTKMDHEKLYRLIQTIAVIGMFASVALAIMMSFNVLKYSAAMLSLVLVILVVSISCMMVLPWVKQLSKSEFKILCYVMFGLTAFSCVLWAADIIVGVKIADAVKAENAAQLLGQLKFLQISLFLTFQIVVANSVASCVVKYRKTMVAFQVITYISNLYIDLYGSIALFCVKISNDGLSFANNVSFISNKISIMFAVMALAFVIISNWVVKRMDKRRQRDALAPMFEDDKKQNQAGEKTVQQKLKELKEMLDNNLISEEEYAKKRDDLINQL